MSGVISPQEALDAGRPVDHIAAIPYSSNIEVVDNRLTPVLSVLSRMAIDAATLVGERHENAELIMLGETCYPGLASTAELMESRALQIHADMPKEKRAILDEVNGIKLDNTVLQVRGLARYLSRQPKPGVVAVGLKYHAERVLTHAHANGLKCLRYVAAEDILHATDRLGEYEKYLPELQQVERSERVLRLLSKVNPSGELFVAAMRKLGPRVVDVVDTEGGPAFVSTFARKRLAEARQKLQSTR